jgi:uncharacterized membrane protein
MFGGKDMDMEKYKSDFKLIGLIAGLIVGLLIAIFGFWKTVLIAVLTAVGWLVGLAWELMQKESSDSSK